MKELTIEQEQSVIKNRINTLNMSMFNEVTMTMWNENFGTSDKSKILKNYYDNNKNIKYVIYIILVFITYKDDFNNMKNLIFMILNNLKRYSKDEKKCVNKPKLEEGGGTIGENFITNYKNIIQLCYIYMDYRNELTIIIDKIIDLFVTITTKLNILKDNFLKLSKEGRIEMMMYNLELDEEDASDMEIIRRTRKIIEKRDGKSIKEYIKYIKEGYELSNLMNRVWNNRIPQEYSLNISTKVKEIISIIEDLIKTESIEKSGMEYESYVKNVGLFR